MNQPSASPSPGWYPDPHGGSELRWFNGTDWANPAPQPAERRFTIHYGFALIALLSLAGTLFFGIPLLASATYPETGGIGFGLGIL